MEGTSPIRQRRYACVLSRKNAGKPPSSENYPVNKEAKDGSSVKQPFHHSRIQYANAVLKAYGIVPVARMERCDFVLSSKKNGESKTNAMAGILRDLLSIEGASDSCRLQYQYTVLKAYGIVLPKDT